MPKQIVLCKGLVERIGIADAQLHYTAGEYQVDKTIEIASHEQGLEAVAKLLMDPNIGIIDNVDEIKAVGHRVVHGGSRFTNTTIIDESVKEVIKSLFYLAPLHNPPNLMGIDVAEKVFPNATQVGVFDTAFHQTIPEVAHRYAIPNEFYKEDHIRVYGFHGTSHQYVSKQAIAKLGEKETKIITIHLGNGCSMTAIKDGNSIDTSLGFGPMNGLIMGTRSGDIDQAVLLYLMEQKGYSTQEITQLLQKKSGMLGLTGMSDLRDIEEAAEHHNKMAQLALDMNAYRIKKYIGAYTAMMNGLDALVFTAGIGENSDVLRAMVCKDMDYLGIKMDENLNVGKKKVYTEIQAADSKVKILVIPTNEELEIARQSYNLLKIKQ